MRGSRRFHVRAAGRSLEWRPMKRPVSVPGSMQARALQAWSFFLSPVPRVLLGIATVAPVAVIGCNTAQISQAANVDAGPACSTLKPIATCDGGSAAERLCRRGHPVPRRGRECRCVGDRSARFVRPVVHGGFLGPGRCLPRLPPYRALRLRRRRGDVSRRVVLHQCAVSAQRSEEIASGAFAPVKRWSWPGRSSSRPAAPQTRIRSAPGTSSIVTGSSPSGSPSTSRRIFSVSSCAPRAALSSTRSPRRCVTFGSPRWVPA